MVVRGIFVVDYFNSDPLETWNRAKIIFVEFLKNKILGLLRAKNCKISLFTTFCESYNIFSQQWCSIFPKSLLY